jgi:hypothetical protein
LSPVQLPLKASIEKDVLIEVENNLEVLDVRYTGFYVMSVLTDSELISRHH